MKKTKSNIGSFTAASTGSFAAPTTLEHSAERNESVDHPRHYTQHPSGVECIDVVEHFGFSLGNAVKYIWRAGLKGPNPVEGLKKARWYLDREISRLTKEGACR